MQVEINNTLVDVEIVYKNNKNIYMRVKEDGKIYVYCNKFVTKSRILELIKANEKSLLKMFERVNKELDSDKYFYYLGKRYVIVIADVDGVYFEDEYIFAKSKEMLDKFYHLECYRLFEMRVNDFKTIITDIPSFKLRIRKMKTRWGVNNTTKRIITLNSELLKRELELLDYVIVHELCHFYEANHSPRFWEHVERYYPKYKMARKRLKEGL